MGNQHGNVDAAIGQPRNHLARPGGASDELERLAGVLVGELEERRAEVLGDVADFEDHGLEQDVRVLMVDGSAGGETRLDS